MDMRRFTAILLFVVIGLAGIRSAGASPLFVSHNDTSHEMACDETSCSLPFQTCLEHCLTVAHGFHTAPLALVGSVVLFLIALAVLPTRFLVQVKRYFAPILAPPQLQFVRTTVLRE